MYIERQRGPFVGCLPSKQGHICHPQGGILSSSQPVATHIGNSHLEKHIFESLRNTQDNWRNTFCRLNRGTICHPQGGILSSSQPVTLPGNLNFRWWLKFTFSTFTPDSNLQTPHLHRTQIYTNPNLHSSDLHKTKGHTQTACDNCPKVYV